MFIDIGSGTDNLQLTPLRTFFELVKHSNYEQYLYLWHFRSWLSWCTKFVNYYCRVQTDPGKPGKPGKCRLLEKIQGKSGKLREFFFKLWITQGNSGNFIFQIPYNRIACISRFGVPDFQKFFSSGPTMVAPQVPLKSLRCLYNVK